METEIISRANVNLGFDFEEAIMEAIDDAFEAAGKPTDVDCWIYQEKNNYSYIIADKAGGTNLEEVFTISINKKYSSRFANVEEIYKRTGMFGAGSLSHLNVSNKVYFLTRNGGEWDVLMLEKVLETGDFLKKQISSDQIDSSIFSMLNSMIKIDQYDSILFVTGVNTATNQTVNDFKEKLCFHGLEKNLRSTYSDKLIKGYGICLNGNKIKPLDVFYSHCIGKGKLDLLKMEITLYELLQRNSYYKEEIFERYLEVFKKTFHLEAEQRLLQEKIVIKFFGYDTKYFNKVYFEKIKPNDKVTFNIETSGAWLFRNGRKVGSPKLLSFMKRIHPEWNGLRVNIEFSPIFDVYFGIQVNKNRFFISEDVQQLIKTKLLEVFGKNGTSRIKDEIKGYEYTPNPQEQLTLDIDEEDRIIEERYRQAEEVCGKELERLGYTVRDVAKNNKGYDLKAKHSVTGEVRYVEVKRIKKVGDAFNLTVNEYNVSISLGEKYFVCLVLLKEKGVSFIWINNPSKFLSFDPVIKIESYKVAEYCSDNEYSVKRNDLG